MQRSRRGLVLGNLEGTLSGGGGSKCGAGSSNSYAFQTPPSYAGRLKKAGFTVLNLANNHAYDYGPVELEETVAALARSDSRSRPPRRDRVPAGGEDRRRPRRLRSLRVGADLTTTPPRAASCKKAAAHADVVIVTMHAGAEGAGPQHTPRGPRLPRRESEKSRVLARRAARARAPRSGSGPHVPRGIEWYRGRLIAYSLGNFAGYKVFALSGPLSISGILRVTLRGDGRFAQLQSPGANTRMVGASTPAQGRARARDRADAVE